MSFIDDPFMFPHLTTKLDKCFGQKGGTKPFPSTGVTVLTKREKSCGKKREELYFENIFNVNH